MGPLYHFGTEYYGNGTRAATLECDGERDTQCSAGNGWMIPTLSHYVDFGVSMKVEGAVACTMSGGTYGANGGKAGLLRRTRDFGV